MRGITREYRRRGTHPRRVPRALAGLGLAALALASRAEPQDAGDGPSPDGEAIIADYLARQDVDSELAFVRMVRSAPGAAEKEYRFLIVHARAKDGGRALLLRLLRPREVEGVSFLAVDRSGDGDANAVQRHLYLPAVGEPQELAEASLDGAFLGSDFTYEDLLREIPSIHAYERLADGTVGGRDCFVVRAVEKDAERSGYAWRDLFIDRETLQLAKIHFHGESKEHTKTLVAYDYGSAEIKGKSVRPRRAVMTNLETGAWTEFTVIESRLDEELPPDLFTPEKLASWKPWEVEEFIFRYGIAVD